MMRTPCDSVTARQREACCDKCNYIRGIITLWKKVFDRSLLKACFDFSECFLELNTILF